MSPVTRHDDHKSSGCHENAALCPACDLMVVLPLLLCGTKANCPRCKTTLSSCWREPGKHCIGYAISALFMLLLANLFPFVEMNVAGITHYITLIHIPTVLFNEDYVPLATLFMVTVQLIPLFCMLAILLLCCKTLHSLWLRVWLAKYLFQLKAWCMVEIFLAGVLVSLVKLHAWGDIGAGTSFIPYCLFCLLQIRAFQCVDQRWLWQDIAPAPLFDVRVKTGETGLSQGLRSCSCCCAILPLSLRQCPRCYCYGYARRRHSLQWTMALLLTSVILYIPANIMPVMVTQGLGNTITSTIMAGIIFLWQEGSYPVAIVIFIASIMVPSLKILAIGWLCWGAQDKGDPERLHVIYQLVESVGRWSMIDVFVIVLLSSLVRMGKFMSVYPDKGAILFAMVVILTMLAAMAFDARLIWDRIPQTLNTKEATGS